MVFDYPTLDEQVALMDTYLDDSSNPIITDIVNETASFQQAQWDATVAYGNTLIASYQTLYLKAEALYQSTGNVQHLKNMNLIINHISDIEEYINGTV